MREHLNDNEYWGYAFELTDNKNKNALNLKPTKGILSPDKHPPFSTADDTITQPQRKIHRPMSYFIPYGKNEKPCWSKARHIYNTHCAKTKEEAEHKYNELVAEAINTLHQRAIQIAENFIMPVDCTIAVPPYIHTTIQHLRKDDVK